MSKAAINLIATAVVVFVVVFVAGKAWKKA
jgi:hypothetical protein